MMDSGRLIRIGLLLLLAMLGYAALLGKGGFLRIRDLDRQIAAQKDANSAQKSRNDALSADVMDLKQGGTDALEERARTELGLVRQGETYYRFVDPPAKTGNP